MTGPATISMLQIRGSSAVVYEEYLFRSRYGRDRLRMNMKRNRKTRYSGKMTQGTRKRLARSATLMAQACKRKWIKNTVTGQLQYHNFTFVTLTISSTKNIDAKTGYQELLAPFLQWMRRVQNVSTYIWKAEFQERGQLHYHITTPSFLDFRQVRSKWNELQRKAGYLDEFIKKFQHDDPNSIDAHAVRDVKDIGRYLVKELAKTMQNEFATKGKIWDCSDNLAGVAYFAIELSNYHIDRLNELFKSKEAKSFTGDRWTIIDFTDSSPPDILQPHERDRMEKYLSDIINPTREEPEIEIKIEPEKIVLPAAKKIIQSKLFADA